MTQASEARRQETLLVRVVTKISFKCFQEIPSESRRIPLKQELERRSVMKREAAEHVQKLWNSKDKSIVRIEFSKKVYKPCIKFLYFLEFLRKNKNFVQLE